MASTSSASHRRRDNTKKLNEEAEPLRKDTRKDVTRSNHSFLNFLTGVILLSGIVLFYFFPHILWEQPTSTVRLNEESPPPFKVVDLPGKGKGVIATRNISQGELLIREKPLFLVPSSISTSPGALLLSSLARLTPAQRKSYYNLSHVNFPKGLTPNTPEYNEALALAIFETNSIAAGDNVGIFPRVARLNHGCSSAFNSVYSWREEGEIVVHALKPIKEGNELLTTYTDTKRPRDVRRAHLQSHYGFTCQCSVCSLPDDLSRKSDERLVKMSDLYAHFARWGDSSIGGKEAVKTARQIWMTGEEEGYWSERGRLAADAVWISAAHSDAEAAREWAGLAFEWFAYELGADSVQAREMQSVMADPRRHHAWGSRRDELVGGPELS